MAWCLGSKRHDHTNYPSFTTMLCKPHRNGLFESNCYDIGALNSLTVSQRGKPSGIT